MLLLMELSKKHIIPTTIQLQKKETLIRVDYYERETISQKTLEKLNKKPITTQNNNILKK